METGVIFSCYHKPRHPDTRPLDFTAPLAHRSGVTKPHSLQKQNREETGLLRVPQSTVKLGRYNP